MRKTVAVVIPVWKEELTGYEKISYLQACRVLSKYEFILISYRKLDITKYTNILDDEGVSYQIKYFNKKYFFNIDSYNQLMLSINFYRRFLFYKYILVYQLDCFVFCDDLLNWIEKGFSYIGAPWLKGSGVARYGSNVKGVGNGGFSLRRVSHHYKVLIIYNFYLEKKHLIWKFIYERENTKPLYSETLELLKKLPLPSTFKFKNRIINEDTFWGDEAKESFPWFRVPDWKIASRFSVEVEPEYFYELNDRKLPFGCHAWWRYDLNFWRPYIENFGFKLTCPEDES